MHGFTSSWLIASEDMVIVTNDACYRQGNEQGTDQEVLHYGVNSQSFVWNIYQLLAAVSVTSVPPWHPVVSFGIHVEHVSRRATELKMRSVVE